MKNKDASKQIAMKEGGVFKAQKCKKHLVVE